eukprot:3160479-Ditylum_brightwellii.AAC.1
MKIGAKSLESANCSVGNRPPPIPFYILDSDKKLSPSDYETYKLRTNLKDEKMEVYLLTIKYYKVGTPEEWLQFVNDIAQVIKGQDIQDGKAAYSLMKSLLKRDVLQVFQKKEESQDVKDGPTFTKCCVAVTKHIFPKKAYKIQKKYMQNIHKPLRLESYKWMSQMNKLNDYSVYFLVPEGMTATKIPCKEFVDILEDGILYQWKLEFEKEGFDLSFSTLKEFLDACVCLEEAELHKLLAKKIACAKKDHEDERKGKYHDKLK